MQAPGGSQRHASEKPRRIVRGNRIARTLIGLVLITTGVLMFTWPQIEEAAGSWQQHELATETDLEIPRYVTAVQSAYDSVFTEMEAFVSFEIGALPTTVAGNIIGLDGGLSARQPLVEIHEERSEIVDESSVAVQPDTLVFQGGTVRIPSIGVDQAIVEGVSRADLRQGPGHYPGTALPGTRGNVVISGHRTTYTKPFYDIDQLVPGDIIWVDTLEGSFRYIVEESFVVDPTNVDALRGSERAILTLTTCTPKGSARQRLIVVAALAGEPIIGDTG